MKVKNKIAVGEGPTGREEGKEGKEEEEVWAEAEKKHRAPSWARLCGRSFKYTRLFLYLLTLALFHSQNSARERLLFLFYMQLSHGYTKHVNSGF